MSFQECSSHIFRLTKTAIGMKHSFYNFSSSRDALALVFEENHHKLHNS